MFFYVALQCRHRACDVGSCEPSSRIDGLHNARDRLCSLSKAHDLVRRRVHGGLRRPLEVPVARLVGRVSHCVSSWEDSGGRSIEASGVSMKPNWQVGSQYSLSGSRLQATWQRVFATTCEASASTPVRSEPTSAWSSIYEALSIAISMALSRASSCFTLDQVQTPSLA